LRHNTIGGGCNGSCRGSEKKDEVELDLDTDVLIDESEQEHGEMPEIIGEDIEVERES
jgi:hypothetical protein